MPSYSKFDRCLYNRTLIVSLQETAWNSLQRHIIGSYYLSDEIPGVTLSYFSDVFAEVAIDVFATLTRQNPSFQFHAGIVGSGEWIQKIRNQTSALIQITLKVQNFVSDPFMIFSDRRQQTTITLNIEDIGVCNKTLTTRCSTEPEIYMMYSEKNCTSKSYLNAVAKRCKCQPFSLRKNRAETSSICEKPTFLLF